jgi:hypothetical protein
MLKVSFNAGFSSSRYRKVIAFAGFAVGLFASASAFAAEYYMSPSGSDSNPGTLAAPWKTMDRLQTAVNNTLRPGDTVYFRGGDYLITNANRTYYSFRAKGTASAPITYKNYQGEKPVIIYDRIDTNNELSTSSVTMLFVSGSYTIIDGLNFMQSERSRSVSTHTVGGVTKYINRPARKSALAVYGSNVVVRNSSIQNFSGLGMATPGTNILVEHNTLSTANHNFYLQGPNSTIRYNYIDGSRQIRSGRTMQIQYEGTNNNMVYGNMFVNGAADAIVFSGRIAGNQVFNNIIINGGTFAYAIGFWCEDGPIGPGNKFYNNTVIGKSAAGLIASGSCKNKDQGEIGRNVQIYNNIFYPSTPVRVGLSLPNVHDNIFYNIKGSVPPGNTLIDPKLVNPHGNKAADAMLQEGSPAIDKAINTSSNPAARNDYQGGKRPFGAGYDLGAFEFGAPPGEDAGPIGGGAFIPPSGPVLIGPNGEVCPTGYN